MREHNQDSTQDVPREHEAWVTPVCGHRFTKRPYLWAQCRCSYNSVCTWPDWDEELRLDPHKLLQRLDKKCGVKHTDTFQDWYRPRKKRSINRV